MEVNHKILNQAFDDKTDVVTLKQGVISVTMPKITMANSLILLMISDAIMIAGMGYGSTIIGLYCYHKFESAIIPVMIATLMIGVSIVKLVLDVRVMVNDISSVISRVGKRCCIDVTSICESLVSAGVKLAEESVSKVQEKKEKVDVSKEEENHTCT